MGDTITVTGLLTGRNAAESHNAGLNAAELVSVLHGKGQWGPQNG